MTPIIDGCQRVFVRLDYQLQVISDKHNWKDTIREVRFMSHNFAAEQGIVIASFITWFKSIKIPNYKVRFIGFPFHEHNIVRIAFTTIRWIHQRNVQKFAQIDTLLNDVNFEILKHFERANKNILKGCRSALIFRHDSWAIYHMKQELSRLKSSTAQFRRPEKRFPSSSLVYSNKTRIG